MRQSFILDIILLSWPVSEHFLDLRVTFLNDLFIPSHVGHSINLRNYFEKKKIIKKKFFSKCKLSIVWNWFIAKIISISQKYLFRGYLKCQ